MYERLRDVPALAHYPSRIPAPVWNAWRRYWRAEHRQTCFGLEELPPMSLLLDEREWVLIVPESDEPVFSIYAEGASSESTNLLLDRYARVIEGLRA